MKKCKMKPNRTIKGHVKRLFLYKYVLFHVYYRNKQMLKLGI